MSGTGAPQRPPMKIKVRPVVDDVVEQKPVRDRDQVRRSVVDTRAGTDQLWIAGVLSGLGLAPLLLDRFQDELVGSAADLARAVAPPLVGTVPSLWPAGVSSVAFAASVVVIALALTGVRLPLPAFPLIGAVFAVCTGFVAWQVIDFVNAPAWYLLPVFVLVVGAFLLSLRSMGLRKARMSGSVYLGSAPMQVLFSWALVAVFLIGGLAAVRASDDDAVSSSPAQPYAASLMSGGDTDPALAGLRGSFVPQVASAVVTSDAEAATYLAKHEDLGTRWPVVLVRGTDVPSETMDAQDWMTVVAQPFASEAEAQAWCAGQGLGPDDCLPRWIPAG